ncbi:SSI family serine proteinase inhibitor [Streptomyces sp. NPDC052676]|uniref:SSI family serine proteinase inhibitor n=1 Tax=Streptomyces sp. NPDC052676 TaxID=3154953 RepID=UPI00343A36A2
MLQDTTTPHTVRRLLVAAGASLAALGSFAAAPAATAAATATAASAGPATGLAGLAGPSSLLPPTLQGGERGRGDHHLTVTVRGAGRGADGTFRVDCHPASGDHPDVAGACRALDRNTRWGQDAFAPVAEGTVCTMQYGGSATARVTGTWAGRPVDATFDRSNGCEIDRWNRLVPLLPDLSK